MERCTLRTPTIIAFVLLCHSLAGCGDAPEDGPGPAPVFPEDYVATFQEVRDCRRSADHDLLWVRVLANAVAHGPYTNRTENFPEGSVLLKEEYADSACTDLERYTAMRREAPGYDPAGGDFRWQRVSKSRKVEVDGKPPTCIGCHATCGVPPDGHDWTCTVP